MTETALYILYGLLAAGAAGLYLCLPSERPGGRRLKSAGAILAAAAVAGIAFYWTRWIDPAFQGETFFVAFAVLALIAAVCVVTHPRPVYSALFFVLVVLSVTGLAILALAEFLAAALVIIYGGAILVTYIFVIMLAQQSGAAGYDLRAREPLAAVVLGFAFAAAATQALVARDPLAAQATRPHPYFMHAISEERPVVRTAVDGAPLPGSVPVGADQISAASNVRQVGLVLFTNYVIAVQVAGVLLLVAMVGGIAIARKRIEPEALTPEERRQSQVEEDLHRRGREAAPF